MESERLADKFLVKSESKNDGIFLKTIKYFVKFIASTFFLQPNVIVVLLNFVDAVNFVDTFEKDNVGIRFFALGSFLHGINFA